MAKVLDINENIPHKVSEVICIKCGYRWVAVRPSVTKLKELECPGCNLQGYTIETGEEINEEYGKG
jgi:Zn finger protein HypA/HybF involved in hydrogenase expression